jgi:hypothetical protein
LIFNIAIVDSVGSDSDGNSDGISLENIEEVRFYNNDPALPVYRWGLLNGLATDDVAGSYSFKGTNPSNQDRYKSSHLYK